MPRMTFLNNPFLLGFDEIERLLDQVTKSTGDGYPPYNIERLKRKEGEPERLCITLAVAGFTRDDLEITVEDSRLTIRGKQEEGENREFLHRGIAARQFQRSFVLADSIEVTGAELKNGLLRVFLERPEPERRTRRIEIQEQG